MDMEKCTDNNELSSQPTDSLPSIALETAIFMQEKELQPRLTNCVSTASHFNGNDDNVSYGSDVDLFE